MYLDHKEAERIARELLAKIASEWKDTERNRCVTENGSYIFVLTLEPSRDARLTSFDLDTPPSILHFNPLNEATEIVALTALDAQRATDDKEKFDFFIRYYAEGRIAQMVLAAPDIFSDAMWQLGIISTTVVGAQMSNAVGKPVTARALIDTALSMIEDRIRHRFGPISKARNPKVNDFTLTTAVTEFLPKFRKTGQLPSRNQFAKALKVTPKAWRDFVKAHPKANHELIVREWLEAMDKRNPK